ncbi:unnamed protein product [Mytilus coruscus]|uniref:Reverse transcriptase domain-containing protein n=1 Tax=Mytilus coruscus TaxID=42192 RepID=A0A6J8DL02_MYTCO|nr:unnamed protein product [Mytilus coruscus]
MDKGALLSKYPFNPIIRGSYFKCYREYTKLRRYKKRHFKQQVLDQLDQLRDHDPKKYWKLINSLKERKNDNTLDSAKPEEWHEYFSELNKPSNLHSNRIHEIRSEVEKLEKVKQFCELDFRISNTEIANSVRKLKNGKASGLDGIPAEMLKAGKYLSKNLEIRRSSNIINAN